MLLWQMDLGKAEMFFLLCEKHKADTEEKRIGILKAMQSAGMIDGVYQWNGDKASLYAEFEKHFNILGQKEVE